MPIMGRMRPARHFTELMVWQLAHELRIETHRLTARGRFARDLKLRGQTEDAAHSACRNIAEGFGCDSHREFARFLVIARRSLNELQDAMKGAEVAGYLEKADLKVMENLFRRVYPALARLIKYLRRPPPNER